MPGGEGGDGRGLSVAGGVERLVARQADGGRALRPPQGDPRRVQRDALHDLGHVPQGLLLRPLGHGGAGQPGQGIAVHVPRARRPAQEEGPPVGPAGGRRLPQGQQGRAEHQEGQALLRRELQPLQRLQRPPGQVQGLALLPRVQGLGAQLAQGRPFQGRQGVAGSLPGRIQGPPHQGAGPAGLTPAAGVAGQGHQGQPGGETVVQGAGQGVGLLQQAPPQGVLAVALVLDDPQRQQGRRFLRTRPYLLGEVQGFLVGPLRAVVVALRRGHLSQQELRPALGQPGSPGAGPAGAPARPGPGPGPAPRRRPGPAPGPAGSPSAHRTAPTRRPGPGLALARGARRWRGRTRPAPPLWWPGRRGPGAGRGPAGPPPRAPCRRRPAASGWPRRTRRRAPSSCSQGRPAATPSSRPAPASKCPARE